jgi:hypothetical protein
VIELIERPGLGKAEEPQRGIRRAGALLALCRGEGTACTARGLGRQLSRALQKGRSRGQATAALRAAGRALELGGDVFVGCRGRVRAMPGAPVGIDFGVRRVGQRAVRPLSLLRRCGPVHRGSDERMAETHLPAELDQVGRCTPRRWLHPERACGAPYRHRVADGLR